jgi:hypothetical protein
MAKRLVTLVQDTRFVGLNGVCKSERVSAGEAHFLTKSLSGSY